MSAARTVKQEQCLGAALVEVVPHINVVVHHGDEEEEPKFLREDCLVTNYPLLAP